MSNTMPPMIWVTMIVGDLEEPFLKAALQSVSWADGFAIVNTAPDRPYGEENMRTIVHTVPSGKLRYKVFPSGPLDFSRARNLSLEMIPEDAYALIVDADDVHYPEFAAEAKALVESGHDIVTAHFWHLMLAKNLWQEEPHREVLFSKESGVRFEGAVHEKLIHPRRCPALAETHYVHYGYIKRPEQILERWKRYSEIEGDPEHYAGTSADEVFGERIALCKPFWREHPPAVRELLEKYPSAPEPPREGVLNTGLILLTYDDQDLLGDCIASLACTRQPFELLVIDCGERRTAASKLDGIERFANLPLPGSSLSAALNVGLRHFIDQPEMQYVGWIHPDMRFDDPRWLECLRHVLDTHPDIGKVCAANAKYPRPEQPIPGQEQCWLMRTDVAERFPFDEGFVGIGGREDWSQNRELMDAGLRVMIWPTVPVYHEGAVTRSRRDTDPEGKANAAYYFTKHGDYGPPC